MHLPLLALKSVLQCLHLILACRAGLVPFGMMGLMSRQSTCSHPKGQRMPYGAGFASDSACLVPPMKVVSVLFGVLDFLLWLPFLVLFARTLPLVGSLSCIGNAYRIGAAGCGRACVLVL